MKKNEQVEITLLFFALFGAICRQPAIDAEKLSQDLFAELATRSPVLAKQFEALLNERAH